MHSTWPCAGCYQNLTPRNSEQDECLEDRWTVFALCFSLINLPFVPALMCQQWLFPKPQKPSSYNTDPTQGSSLGWHCERLLHNLILRAKIMDFIWIHSECLFGKSPHGSLKRQQSSHSVSQWVPCPYPPSTDCVEISHTLAVYVRQCPDKRKSNRSVRTLSPMLRIKLPQRPMSPHNPRGRRMLWMWQTHIHIFFIF